MPNPQTDPTRYRVADAGTIADYAAELPDAPTSADVDTWADEAAWQFADGDRRAFIYPEAAEYVRSLWGDELADAENYAAELGTGTAGETLADHTCRVAFCAVYLAARDDFAAWAHAHGLPTSYAGDRFAVPD